MKKNNTTQRKVIAISLLALSLIVVSAAVEPKSSLTKGLDTTAVELTYKAKSPLGAFGGVALPASCESNAWNANNGYHLDGVTADPGNCGAVLPAASNLPPETPVLGGTIRLALGASIGAWDITSKDPDGDRVFFEVDWDGNGSSDGTTPVVNSEQPFIAGHIYNEVGTYTIRARAREADWPIATNWINKFITTAHAQVSNNGKTSGWGTYQVEVYDPTVNLPPLTPTISGDQWAIVSQATANWIVATDPDGDNIFYELDWDGNGSVDGSTGSAASGASLAIGHIYNSVGTYQVNGRAVQANNTALKSGWGTYTIRVTNGTCTAPANACGVTNGTVSGGQCVAPGLPAGYGTSCSSAANICGMRDNSGTIDCSGSCANVTVPSNTLCSCTSAANSCGMTNTGNWNAAGTVCSASAPSNSACAAPVVPGPAATINDFRASPKLIAVNKTSRLYWDITGNISSCTISYTTNTSPAPVQVTSNLGANIGNLETSPVSEKRYYKLKCGAAEREAIVSVFSLTEI